MPVRTVSQASTLKYRPQIRERKGSVAEIRQRQDYRITKRGEHKKEAIKMPTKFFTPALEFNVRGKEEIANEVRREPSSRQGSFRTRNLSKSTERVRRGGNTYETVLKMLKK
jgi:hypothetical protein